MSSGKKIFVNGPNVDDGAGCVADCGETHFPALLPFQTIMHIFWCVVNTFSCDSSLLFGGYEVWWFLQCARCKCSVYKVSLRCVRCVNMVGCQCVTLQFPLTDIKVLFSP